MLKILVIQEWVLFFLMGDLGVVVFVNCECSVLSLRAQRSNPLAIIASISHEIASSCLLAMTSKNYKCDEIASSGLPARPVRRARNDKRR